MYSFPFFNLVSFFTQVDKEDDKKENKKKQNDKLIILGASYGVHDVTSQIRLLVKQQGGCSLEITPSDKSFPFINNKKQKSFVVIYTYDQNYKKGGHMQNRIATSQDNNEIVINDKSKYPLINNVVYKNKLTIYGVVFGDNVKIYGGGTSIIKGLINNNQVQFSINDATFVEDEKDAYESCIAVYGTNIGDFITKAGPSYALKQLNQAIFNNKPKPHLDSQLYILGASYANQDVTDIVKNKICKNKLGFVANERNFGVVMPGQAKSCVVVYAYVNKTNQEDRQGHFRTRIAIVQHNQKMEIDENKQHPVIDNYVENEKLIIYGATYGIADVTETVAGLINETNQSLEFTVNVATFGEDTWPEKIKTFTIVYGNTIGQHIPKVYDPQSQVQLP